jgi:hypothetical protein
MLNGYKICCSRMTTTLFTNNCLQLYRIKYNRGLPTVNHIWNLKLNTYIIKTNVYWKAKKPYFHNKHKTILLCTLLPGTYKLNYFIVPRSCLLYWYACEKLSNCGASVAFSIACNVCRDKRRTRWSVLMTMIRSTDKWIPTCYPRWSVLLSDCDCARNCSRWTAEGLRTWIIVVYMIRGSLCSPRQCKF